MSGPTAALLPKPLSQEIVTQPSNGTTIASPPATETTMLRDCPTEAKATLALIALSAICILGWLADLGL